MRRHALPFGAACAYAALFLLLSGGFLFSRSPGGTEVKGQVHDPQGLIIVNAQVHLLPVSENSPNRTEYWEASTDVQGRFEFSELISGHYRLRVCAIGFRCDEIPIELGDTAANVVVRLPVAGVYEGVQVTATRQETETSKTILSSALVSSEHLERQIALNLAQALEAVPGVTWVNAGSFRSRPVIRGLDSNRVLVLVDGERLNNARTSTNNSGLETSLVDLSQIQQVEIVNGPGSVLYGSDAIGGVVNIRTRTAMPSEKLRLGARARGEFFPNSDGQRTHLDLSGGYRWWTANASASLAKLNDYRSPAGRVYESGVRDSSALVDLRLYPSLQHIFSAKFLHHGAYNFGVPTVEANPDFLGIFPFSKLQKFSGGYTGYFRSRWFSTLNARMYSQVQPRDFFNDTFAAGTHVLSDTVTRVRTSGFDAQVTAAPTGRHELTYGFNTYRDSSHETRLQVLQAGGVSTVLTQAPSTPDSALSNAGLFLQEQFEASRRLRFVGGIRLDRFNLSASNTDKFDANAFTLIQSSRSDAAWSGALGTSITLHPTLTVTAHVARAFREPNLFERYFFGRGSSGGFIVPNPNLSPETSVQLDLGTRFYTRFVRTSVNYFSHELRNLITAAPGTFLGQSVRSGQQVRQNVNINRARIQGVESKAELSVVRFHAEWTPVVTLVWQHGTNRTTGQPLGLISPLATQASLRWVPRGARLWSEWRTHYVKAGRRVPAGENAIPGFTVLAWRSGYEFSRSERATGALLPRGVSSINLQFGIENLANRLYRGLFETVPQPGREYRFALNFNFGATTR